MNDDLEQLRLLSIFHYVWGGILAVTGLFPVLHLGIGIALLTGIFDRPGDVPPRMVGWLFVGISLLVMAASWIFAVCALLAGRFLARRAHRDFCMVVAALECLLAPLGTILGVFTIVILSRPSVRACFDDSPAPPVRRSG